MTIKSISNPAKLAVQKAIKPGMQIFFAGIGGSSMAGLARLSASLGMKVSGCDRENKTPQIDNLRASGIPVYHEEENPPLNCDLLVHSAALSMENPVLKKAAETGTSLCTRADYLAGLSADYPIRIAIAGTHGKSTVVGMLTKILTDAGYDPTVSAGAPLTVGGESWRKGEHNVFLCEACEYKNSFLSLNPTIGVVTNMEWDHPDCFPDFIAVKNSFSAFLSRCENRIVNGDCKSLVEIAGESQYFGFEKQCNLRGIAIGKQMQIWESENQLGAVLLKIPGNYNLTNALAAIAVSRMLHIPFLSASSSIRNFHGVGRRMEYVGCTCGAPVYIDYAHHPTQIVAAIQALRSISKRVLCVFQPHTYSRTKTLWKDFISALQIPDETFLLDIFAARESPLNGITSSELAKAANVRYVDAFERAAIAIRTCVHPGDVVVVMGAGNIPELLPYLLDSQV